MKKLALTRIVLTSIVYFVVGMLVYGIIVSVKKYLTAEEPSIEEEIYLQTRYQNPLILKRILEHAKAGDLITCDYDSQGLLGHPQIAVLVEKNNAGIDLEGIRYKPPSLKYPPSEQIVTGTFPYDDFKDCKIQVIPNGRGYDSLVGGIIMNGLPLPE